MWIHGHIDYVETSQRAQIVSHSVSRLSLNLTALGQRAWIPISEAIFRVLRVCANDAVITSNQNINQRQQQITNHRIHVYTVYSALPWRVAIVHRKSARCEQTTIVTSTVNVLYVSGTNIANSWMKWNDIARNGKRLHNASPAKTARIFIRFRLYGVINHANEGKPTLEANACELLCEPWVAIVCSKYDAGQRRFIILMQQVGRARFHFHCTASLVLPYYSTLASRCFITFRNRFCSTKWKNHGNP